MSGEATSEQAATRTVVVMIAASIITMWGVGLALDGRVPDVDGNATTRYPDIIDVAHEKHWYEGAWKPKGQVRPGVLYLTPWFNDEADLTIIDVGPTRTLRADCKSVGGFRWDGYALGWAHGDFLLASEETSWIYNNVSCEVRIDGSREFPAAALVRRREMSLAHKRRGAELLAELHYTTREGAVDMLTGGVFVRPEKAGDQ